MASTTEASSTAEASAPVVLPRITITFCTQCRWMLRAAYFAQELLSTFSTSLGEVALIPATGGVFTIDLVTQSPSQGQELSSTSQDAVLQRSRLWDRKAEGGFPEVKHLKQLVRNIIDPGRDLGHSDSHVKKGESDQKAPEAKKPSGAEQTGGGPDAPNEVKEGTIPTDPDAAIAVGPPG